MKLKLHILFFFTALLLSLNSLADENFLQIKGCLIDELSQEPLSDFTVKVVQDRLDSNSTYFAKSKYKVWLPANRKCRVYFIKDGYILKHIYVNASAIPSMAYKKKQLVELSIEMTPLGADCKQDFSKPIYTAEYVARINGFEVKKTAMACESSPIDKNYSPPFPAPVDTYKGVKPTINSLELTSAFNKSKAKSKDYSILIQGILFADMNYCLFNERTNEANEFLTQLQEIDQGRWGNIKAFDSPEFGKIVMRTVNREQSADTLFALGAFIETTRLIFNNFTSDSKVLVHLKQLKNTLEKFSSTGLSENQKAVLDQLLAYVPAITELETKYTHGLKYNLNFEMAADEQFISLKKMNQQLYESLVD